MNATFDHCVFVPLAKTVFDLCALPAANFLCQENLKLTEDSMEPMDMWTCM